MELTDLVVAALLITVFILIFAISVDNTIPAFIRTEFDNICNRYTSVLSINGGLSEADIGELKNELKNLGLTDISVVAPGKEYWGNEGSLKVTAFYEHETVNENFGKDNNSKKLVYENSTVIFGLEN